MRVSATGDWSFAVGSEFEVIVNGESVQAVHGNRIVYVGSLLVGHPGQLIGAAELRATAARRFGAGERFSHVGDSIQGDAEIIVNGDALQLRGTMCADNNVATCLIDFSTPKDRDWAIEVWKSLRCENTPD